MGAESEGNRRRRTGGQKGGVFAPFISEGIAIRANRAAAIQYHGGAAFNRLVGACVSDWRATRGKGEQEQTRTAIDRANSDNLASIMIKFADCKPIRNWTATDY